ncbi:hypothetical protein BAUCODRAFT_118238 [Baudoinia panamericana UAMH 10762]|uniref:Uncharacterized protein n=1 Tax=Baudoinia panamericana (strain UAMH 10762) TaxID=717646 RepID=M2NMQ6_BAUPA|nr:uncharacterized protein BAUCODRAFT_118238 [Baudoinia panamericana UAMH 10762]EMD00471.1 hypothetical protein BAUCODRAFT_118238 [Baudoinia panamericana UAMH 10762]
MVAPGHLPDAGLGLPPGSLTHSKELRHDKPPAGGAAAPVDYERCEKANAQCSRSKRISLRKEPHHIHNAKVTWKNSVPFRDTLMHFQR